jgi:hypothetical protein
MSGASHGTGRRGGSVGRSRTGDRSSTVGLPGLVRAWAPSDVRGNDRMPVRDTLVVGRSTEASWTIADVELSGRHFEVRRVDSRLLVRDLESTNGCAVNGEWLTAPREVEAGDLLRAGRCLFVVHPHPGTAPSPSRTTVASAASPAERLANAPARFAAVVRRTLHDAGIDPLPAVAAMRTEDIEALTLLGPSARADQEREAVALEMAALVRDTCDGPAAILHHLVKQRHGDSPVLQRVAACVPGATDEASAYERRREIIVAAYREVGGDVHRLETLLKSRGIPCSRKWLTIYLERWGARAMRLAKV